MSSIIHVSEVTSQQDFLKSLGLRMPGFKSIFKECSIKILGSKCAICKRIFKCVTDTDRHIRKRHRNEKKYVKVTFKLNGEIIRCATISQKLFYKKFLKSEKYQESRRDDELVKSVKDKNKVKEKSRVKLQSDYNESVSLPLALVLKDLASHENSMLNYPAIKNSCKYSLLSKNKENQSDIIISKTSDSNYLKLNLHENNNDRNELMEVSSGIENNNSEDTKNLCSQRIPRTDGYLSPADSTGSSATIINVYDYDYPKDCEDLEILEKTRSSEFNMKNSDSFEDDEIKIVRSFEENDQTLSVERKIMEETENSDVLVTSQKKRIIEIEVDSDLSDAETVILKSASFPEVGDTVGAFGEVKNQEVNLENLEEGDHDIELLCKPELEDYLLESVVRYIEDCRKINTGISSDKNNNENFLAWINLKRTTKNKIFTH